MQILGYLASAGSLVCWILVLVQMFQREKTLSAVFGIICGLWAFIWGWKNNAATGQKNIMIIWTACIIAGAVANSLATASILG